MSGSYLSHKIGVTRKPHQCRVCGDTIQPGEVAMIYHGTKDGEGFYTSHFHSLCWDYSRDWTEIDWDMLPGCVSRDEIRKEMR